MRRATLIATLTRPPSAEELARLGGEVEWLEVRADLAPELDPVRLWDGFPGKLLYTLRSRAEGGGFDGSEAQRAERLGAAARVYDLVDLEGERDLEPALLAEVPAEKRLISWHGPAAESADLVERFETMAATPARLYKLVPEARQSGDEVAPLDLLRQLQREDVVAFAGGTIGFWSRLVAPRLGAPWVYGAAGAEPAAPGQPSIEQLRRDFGLPELPPVEALFGVVGHPVLHSLSPRLHNAMYRRLGLPFLYLPFDTERFGDFWLEVVEGGGLEEAGLPIRGLSITAPFKGAALAVTGAGSPLAEGLGAVNTLVQRGVVWEGENTDCEGVMLSLARHGREVTGQDAAVVGAGRAGRAAAFALTLGGAQVTLTNRNPSRGWVVAEELQLPFVPLTAFDPGGYSIVVHATSLGREETDLLPFAVERLHPAAVLVDLVYGSRPTRLGRAAGARGVEVIDGREVLLHQALAQFRLMTGREMDVPFGLRVLGLTGDPGGAGR
ncbi:MAG TPA: type I 3-dehydroquinate dehydratase [Thermoanaerobaculia bacterium]|nr:type I 3-dehydroquinate dehydratase [Thermoanaerobaculia bacterium]